MKPAFLRPLSERDFRLLWTGQTVSLIGDGVFTVALAWEALRLSSRPTGLAAVLFARSVPTVLLLILGGAITDRINRRTLLIASDAVRGAAVGAIALLVFTHGIRMWHLIALGAVFGAANAFFFPAYTAIVPEVLPVELLPAGNALGTTARLLGSSFAGPAIGGLLVAGFGTGWAFLADAASFAIAVASAVPMKVRTPRTEAREPILRAVRDGWQFTRSQSWLYVTLIMAGVGNLSFGALGVLIPVFVKEHLHGSAVAYGALSAALGIGGAIAAGLVGQFGLPRRRVASMYAAWIIAALTLIGLGVSPVLAVAGVTMVLCGFTLEYGNVVWTVLMQELVPARMLGRVSSLDWMLSLGLTPVSLATAGPLAGAVGAGPILVGAGLLSALSGVAGVTRKGVLDPDRTP